MIRSVSSQIMFDVLFLMSAFNSFYTFNLQESLRQFFSDYG